MSAYRVAAAMSQVPVLSVVRTVSDQYASMRLYDASAADPKSTPRNALLHRHEGEEKAQHRQQDDAERETAEDQGDNGEETKGRQRDEDGEEKLADGYTKCQPKSPLKASGRTQREEEHSTSELVVHKLLLGLERSHVDHDGRKEVLVCWRVSGSRAQ